MFNTVHRSSFYPTLGIDAWWPNFKTFIAEERNITDWRQTINGSSANGTEVTESDRTKFPMLLSDFLFSRRGSKYKNYFHFAGELVCNAPVPNITVSFEALHRVENKPLV